MIYRLIGKAVVNLGASYAKRRYRQQLVIAGVAGGVLITAALGAAAYRASRDVPEG